ncbi:MAG TPA: molybdopterin dinucleotide binding domain-containing protein [Thermoanaerobaculia bacterium]|nr:molybdopterin dinucleotide binding domain-containing protein [Thermoanaerobaculia bacterium]
MIIINPLREVGLVRFRVPSLWKSLLFGSQIADVYLQPHIGGDVALLKALLKGVVETGAIDAEFVRDHTMGWDAVLADLAAAHWDDLVRASGVPRSEIDAAVRVLAASKRGIFLWAMGLTHHMFGVDNIFALCNLALARGWLGRKGCGLVPIRGHSNVQGVGSMGVSPQLREAFAKNLEALYGITATGGGQDTYSSMTAAHEGRIIVAFLLGGNLFASNPDRAWSASALRKIPTTVYVTTKLNEGHVHGRGQVTLILPVLARDEEGQATTQESMFNYVRLSEGGVPAIKGDLRSEVEVIASLAERILPPGRFDWSAMRSHKKLREEIARAVPGFSAIDRIEGDGELQIEGRTFHEPLFRTSDGKAHFHPTPVPEREAKDGEFLLMTIRSEGQFNTVVYEEEDVYRGNRRDVVMMSKEDADALGAGEEDRVIVETDAGSMTLHVSLAEIRPGNIAAYYPEANALVPRRVDPRSKTPAFKSVVARVRKA